MSSIERQINEFPPDYKEEDAQAEVRDLLKQPSEVPESGSSAEEVPESGSPKEITAKARIRIVEEFLDIYMSVPPDDKEFLNIIGGALDALTELTDEPSVTGEPPADQRDPE